MSFDRKWCFAAACLLAVACGQTLDSFLFSGVHCSRVGPETCEDKADEYWNQICTSCDEPYDFGRDYEWQPNTLDETVTEVRAIAGELVTNHNVPTADGEGELDVYHIAAHGGVPALAETTIVFNHGNYGSIEHYLPRIRFLHEAGFAIIAWDYRGYGKTEPPSHPTPEQFIEDSRTIWDFAHETAVNSERIIVHAHSLGAIPAVEMAVYGGPCAVFLEAPFTSTAQLANSSSGLSLPGGFVSAGHFENTEKIANYPGPLLVMHGTADRTFSVEDVTELHDAAPGPKELWLLDGVAHGISSGGVPEAGLGPYFEKMRTFLEVKAPKCLGQQ